jgi:hypothetical protein
MDAEGVQERDIKLGRCCPRTLPMLLVVLYPIICFAYFGIITTKVVLYIFLLLYCLINPLEEKGTVRWAQNRFGT